MTGSTAETLVVSSRWEVLFEKPLWRDRVRLRNYILRKKGRGLGKGWVLSTPHVNQIRSFGGQDGKELRRPSWTCPHLVNYSIVVLPPAGLRA